MDSTNMPDSIIPTEGSTIDKFYKFNHILHGFLKTIHNSSKQERKVDGKDFSFEFKNVFLAVISVPKTF